MATHSLLSLSDFEPKVIRTDERAKVTFTYKGVGNNHQSITYSKGLFDLAPKKRKEDAVALLHKYYVERSIRSRVTLRPAGQ